jgi:putative tryptophan/tyrosine transport system substrate-binding protein
MKRRDFIALLGGAATWPIAVRAQQLRIPVIGYLDTATPDQTAPFLAAFRQGLAESGFVEGRDAAIEFASAATSSQMKRREFFTLLGGATAWPFNAYAQQPTKLRRIAYLSPSATFNPVDEAFEKSLEVLGWVRDQNIKIEYRYTRGRQDKVAPLVAEVVGLGLDLFVTWGPPLALAVKQAAPQSPVVFLGHADPVAFGVVSNLARPGGNVTGIAAHASEQIDAKRLELLKEAVPSLARVAVLFSTERNRGSGEMDAVKAAAKALRVQLDEIEVEIPEALDAAISGAKDRGAQGIYVWIGGFAFSFGKRISDIANANGLPSIHPFREGAVAGGLLAYASDIKEMARRTWIRSSEGPRRAACP